MRNAVVPSIKDTHPVGTTTGPTRRSLLAGAAALALTGPRIASADQKVVFGVDFYILGAPVRIAQDKGYFREFGVDAEIQPFSLGIDSVDAVLTGRVNFGIAIDFATNTRLQSGQLKVVTALLEPEPGFHKLAVAAGIGKPQDLAGKRIGIANGTAQHLVTMEYLRHAGINPSQVTLLPLLSPLELVASLRANRIDAAFLWGDATNQATTIPGVTILSDDKPALVRSYGYMLTSNQFAAQNPKAVENSLRALAKAVQWMEANPAEAATLMAGHAKAPLEVIKAQMPLQHYTVSLTQPQLDAFNRIAEFSAANKVTRVKVEPRKFIDTSFLKKVDAKRVTLGD